MANDTLEQRVQKIEGIINALMLSDRYAFQRHIQIFDGRNIQLGNGTGTKIGTEATQKVGFYGVAPVAQHGAISSPSGGTTTDTQARATITTIISALHSLGLIA